MNEAEERRRVEEKVDKLKKSKFKQQTLPAWRPIPSFCSTMVTFGVFGIVFLVLGIMLYTYSDQIKEVKQNYTNCQSNNAGNCTLTLEIAEDIEPPIYVYYELENFYQNHRRYVKSRDYSQLMGNYKTVDEIQSSCDPIVYNANLTVEYAYDGTTKLVADQPANPCGLVAKSVFTDTYTLMPGVGIDYDNQILIDQTNIAWESDVNHKFKNCDDCVNAAGEKVDW